MAEVLSQRVLAADGIRAGSISSAGTLQIEGRPASEPAVQVVAELGLDLGSHVSQGVSEQLVGEADKIVVMAPRHVEEVTRFFPESKKKLVRLWEYTNKPGRLTEIADPIHQPYPTYIRCRNDLLECLRNWSMEMKNEPGSSGAES